MADLNRANNIFKEFYKKINEKILKQGGKDLEGIKALLYLAFITGFNANSGMREMIA